MPINSANPNIKHVFVLMLENQLPGLLAVGEVVAGV